MRLSSPVVAVLLLFSSLIPAQHRTRTGGAASSVSSSSAPTYSGGASTSSSPSYSGGSSSSGSPNYSAGSSGSSSSPHGGSSGGYSSPSSSSTTHSPGGYSSGASVLAPVTVPVRVRTAPSTAGGRLVPTLGPECMRVAFATPMPTVTPPIPTRAA